MKKILKIKQKAKKFSGFKYIWGKKTTRRAQHILFFLDSPQPLLQMQ